MIWQQCDAVPYFLPLLYIVLEFSRINLSNVNGWVSIVQGVLLVSYIFFTIQNNLCMQFLQNFKGDHQFINFSGKAIFWFQNVLFFFFFTSATFWLFRYIHFCWYFLLIGFCNKQILYWSFWHILAMQCKSHRFRFWRCW